MAILSSPPSRATTTPLSPSLSAGTGLDPPPPKKKRGRPPKTLTPAPSSHSPNGHHPDSMQTDEGEEGEQEVEGEGGKVVLREGDAKRLLLAWESIDPANILDQPIAPTTTTSTTLRASLTTPDTTLSSLRKRLLKAITGPLAAASTRSETVKIGEFVEACTALLDDFERIYTTSTSGKAAAATGAGVKRENETPAEGGEEGPSPAKKKFMLHRSLHSLDLFTNAAELSTNDLSHLATLEDTDVSSVMPSTSLSIIPTIKDIKTKPKNAPTSLVKRSTVPPKPAPVTLLYYDPFSSFAPTYDSTGSTSSYQQTTTARLNKSAIKKWENEVLSLGESSGSGSGEVGGKKRKEKEVSAGVAGGGMVVDPSLQGGGEESEDGAETMPIASTSTSTTTASHKTLTTRIPTRTTTAPPLTLTLSETSLLASLGLDPHSVIEGIKSVEEERKVWEELERNSELLGVLIRGQWERLKKVNNGKEGGSSKNSGTSFAGEVESDSANQLFQSLTSILSSRPSTSLIPSPTRIHELLPFIVGSFIREPVYQGTLDEKNFKAVRESGMGKKELS